MNLPYRSAGSVGRRSDGLHPREPTLFLIDWLKGAIPVEKEICVLATKDEAIAAAKTRAPDVAKRHSGREPDSFRLTDAGGKILAIVPIRDWKR